MFQKVTSVRTRPLCCPWLPTNRTCILTPCPHAAELVAENCEAYEPHMRDVRDHLEQRLVVSTWSPGRWMSAPRTAPSASGQ